MHRLFGLEVYNARLAAAGAGQGDATALWDQLLSSGNRVYAFAGDEHGRLTITDPSRPPRLGERIEFFPPHCDPTVNLYDRVYAVHGPKVEAVWEIEARGRSD